MSFLEWMLSVGPLYNGYLSVGGIYLNLVWRLGSACSDRSNPARNPGHHPRTLSFTRGSDLAVVLSALRVVPQVG